jgi:hypothetical protein
MNAPLIAEKELILSPKPAPPLPAVIEPDSEGLSGVAANASLGAALVGITRLEEDRHRLVVYLHKEPLRRTFEEEPASE